jgi:PAS domain S-box-containing protein
MRIATDVSVVVPGYHLTEQLYSGSRTLVYQAIRDTDQQPVVIKLLKRDYPGFSELLQFRNQYTIAKSLDLPGVVEPYSLEPYRNSYALVMEDFGGISVREYARRIGTSSQSTNCIAELLTDRPLPITPQKQAIALPIPEFLTIALQLADILNGLHHNRIIHKDIKPTNILINPDTKQVKLIDFSISSLLPRETQTIQTPSGLEGTLAYLSPEQTGRMNRGIDYRSDFYSLGITFFELLTGQLPFASKDPMEIVHCHIAVQPPAVDALNPAVPPVVSDIVAKLMAKNAENRYQSASGLKHDLEKCLTLWRSQEQLTRFPLGERDISDRFLIPEHLYGREAEILELLNAFERVSKGNAELLLVAGFSGIGKTAVVNEVHKPIVRQRGYFVKGKFDQFQRNIPFSAFVQAFRDLMGQLLSETDEQLHQWKTRILNTLGENAQVLIEVIPELEQIVGQQPSVPELSGSAAQNRFNLLFQKFIQVFTTPDHPLVVFIDDLQWADSASLKLLQLLMNDAGHLLILGAYRDNEVSPTHPLMQILEEIQKARAIVNTITLMPLDQASINQLVADTLSCDLALALPLTELVMNKTKGNPFFTTQFLRALHEDELVTFNMSGCYWECDIAKVRQMALSDDVVEFMALQLQKLPAQTQTVLKLAACVGNQFDLATLAIVYEASQAEAAAALWKALQDGLVIPTSEVYKFYHQDKDGNPAAQNPSEKNPSKIDLPSTSPSFLSSYRFLHDRVQQAAYSLIPDSQKKLVHLKIGQLLLKNASPEVIEAKIFDIVNQINEGIEILVQPSEKYEIAQLNLIAGKKAKLSTAYKAAAKYFTLGTKILLENSWEIHHSLTVELYQKRAECEYLVGNFDRAEELFSIILSKAQDKFIQASVYSIQMYLKMTQGENIKASLEAGLKGLSVMGMHLPTTPEGYQAAIKTQLEELNTQLGVARPADCFDLPEMTDPVQRVCVSLLADLWAAAYMAGDHHLSSLAPLLMINLSLKHGNAESSGFAYCLYGMSLANQGDYRTAYEFGSLALKLDRSLNSTQFVPKTNNIFAHTINPYNQHLKTNVPISRQSFQASQETGNLVFGVWAVSFLIWAMLIKGDRLSDVYAETEKYWGYVQQVNDVNMLYAFTLQQQFLLHLQGISKNTDLLHDLEHFNSQAISQETSQETPYIEVWRQKGNFEHGINWYCFLKLQLSYLYGYYADALGAATEAEKTLAANSGFFPIIQYHFYYPLTLAALYPAATLEQKNQYWETLQQHQQILKNWADHCPYNFLHREQLLSAEMARVSGDRLEASELYDRAIAEAIENEYLQEEALANELAAKFYLEWGKDRIAQEYMIEAYYGYARWGAKAKIANLEADYPQLLAPILQQAAPPLSTTETIFALTTESSTTGSSSSGSTFALDLTTILKAFQTLSSEIELEKLLSTLLHVVIENAGADRCVLLLSEEAHLMIRAICSTTHEGSAPDHISLQSPQPLEDNAEVAVCLINTVRRSLKPTVIVDATLHPQFVNNRYIQSQKPKSILCSPILQQGKLLGVLYLENHLTAGAFTNDRIEILNLLCTQAAISLENAQLYQQSQIYAQQLERSLEKLRASEARFQRLADNVPGAIYQLHVTADGSSSASYVSSGCYNLYGVTAEEIMAGVQDFRAMEHPDDVAAIDRAMHDATQRLAPFIHEWRIITSAGHTKWVQGISRPDRQADGSIFWDGVLIDISDRKAAEEALRVSEKNLRTIFDHSNNAILLQDVDATLLDVNDRMLEMYRLESREQALALSAFDYSAPDNPFEQTSILWERALAGETVCFEWKAKRPGDGSVFDIEVVLNKIMLGEKEVVVASVQDISDRKQAEIRLRQKTEELEQTLQELNRTQLQVIQSEKMSSLGQMVAGVAHEINNPVNFIHGNLIHVDSSTQELLNLVHLYQQHYPHPAQVIQDQLEAIELPFLVEDLTKVLQSMHVGTHRIREIVLSLRNFSRLDEAEVKDVNVHDGIDSTLTILHNRLKGKAERPEIQIVKAYGNLPLVECYAGQLNQVFMNIISNAIDALDERDQQRSYKDAELNPSIISIQTEVTSKNSIRICIADNGAGIEEQVKQRLFDPFFTTKPIGKGTGLGLSISYQIVTEKHNGKLWCNSIPGQGTQFTIEIPLHRSTFQAQGASV